MKSEFNQHLFHQNGKHINSVDHIRVIASLTVAIFHLGGKVLPVLKFGWLGVNLFFVLTGFIICRSMPAFYKFRNSVQMLSGAVAAVIVLLPLTKNRLITFFSKISFSLYLTHDTVGSNLVVYLGTLHQKTIYYKGVCFISGLAVSILFAWLFYLVIEKPFFKLSKSIKYLPAGSLFKTEIAA